jgi:hypothetical protein
MLSRKGHRYPQGLDTVEIIRQVKVAKDVAVKAGPPR